MSESLKVTVLGCGSSGGVPRIGGDWGVCDPSEPRNRRRRCSLLVERGETKVLIDTAPEIRDQLIDAGVGTLHGVLYTHAHADQAHGIDDLRVVALNMGRQVDVYGDEATLATLTQRFDYCFVRPKNSDYPPVLTAHTITGPVTIDGPGGPITAIPFLQGHGRIHSLGFRIGPVAYSPDVVELPEAAFEALDGTDCWIVDALRYRPHPTHAHLEKTLEWIARVRPARAVLTNMHLDLDYATLKAELPADVEPAYDGMTLEF